jgi:glycosyltransferase involved in cell wall biosynthesis
VSTVLIETETSLPAAGSPPPEPELTTSERLRTAWQLARLRAKEYLQFDASILHRVGATVARWLAAALIRVGQYPRGFNLLTRLHRGAFSPRTTKYVETFVRTAIANRDPRLASLLRDYVEHIPPSPGTANFWEDPRRMLGTLVLVLSPAGNGRKGVLLLTYNHVFPLFARFFDLPRVAERYHLVLEPSWTGYCDLNLLPYTQLPGPVFVEVIEPYDLRFLAAISSNLVPVPVSANWWVDYRRLRPLPEVEKDHDVVMVAGWGNYKRHHRFFAALIHLRRQGHKLQVLLLGYSVGWTKEAILRQAEYYGIRDQLELRECVPYHEVNLHLNRAKAHVLWSRREGFNRAIIETMFAGLPCILRRGFNHGYHYPYINDQTGRIATETSLPRTLLEMTRDHDQYSPREWVMDNMNCHHATARLEEAVAGTLGEPVSDWSGKLAVKINELSSMRYFDELVKHAFESDYQALASFCR